MKKRMQVKFLLGLIGIFLPALVKAQYQLSVLPYNTSDIGYYGAATIGKKINDHYYLNIGLTIHYNQQNLPDRNSDLYLRKRFKATESIEYIGITGNLQRTFLSLNPQKLRTYFFCETTVRNISASSFKRTQVDLIHDTLNDAFYPIMRDDYTLLKSLWSLDNIIGIGLEVRVFKSVYFTSNFGAGTNIIFKVPDYISKNGVTAEYSLKHNVGVKIEL